MESTTETRPNGRALPLQTSRWQALRDLPWMVFLVWTAVGFIVLPLGFDERQIQAWLGNDAETMRALATGVLRASDAIWICLAASVVYLSVAAAEGLSNARIWAAIILPCAALVEWIGATTGFPFGPYVYTDRFGLRIGEVLPFTIPLAWFIILRGSRALVLWLRPAATRGELCLSVALLGVLTDLNLEMIAWQARGYWIWSPGLTTSGSPVPTWPPWQNFLSWFGAMFLLCYLLPAGSGLRLHRPTWAARRPATVLVLMNSLFLLSHLAQWFRGPR